MLPSLRERSLSDDQSLWLNLSPTQMGTWDRCEKLWNYSYLQGFTSDYVNPGLQVGTMFHDAAQIWYTTQDSEKVTEYFKALLDQEGYEDILNEAKRALRIFRRYQVWSADKDVGHRVIAVEDYNEIPLTTYKGYHFILHGYADLITEYYRKKILWDHKTSGNASAFGWNRRQIQAHFQTNAYALIQAEKGESVDQVMINAVNTHDYKDFGRKKSDELFKREYVYKSPIELLNFKKELFRTVDDIVERGENPKRSMRRDCSTCRFFDPCMMSLQGFEEAPLLLRYVRKDAVGT